MDEQDRPAVGTVAQEAARLLDALGEWAQSTTDHRTDHGPGNQGPGNHGPGNHGPADRGSQEQGSPDNSSQHNSSQHNSSQHNGSQDGTTRAAAGPDRCEHCGSETGVGRAVACRLCPVCQGIALLRSVRPETVDRLADLAGAVTTALRDLAASQRAASSGNQTRDQGTTRRATPVQDITIEDEESGTP